MVEGLGPTGKGQALKVKVRAIPEKGAANRALEKIVAKWLGVPRTTVQLVKGSKSRLKTISITGDPEELAARLNTLTESDPSNKI